MILTKICCGGHGFQLNVRYGGNEMEHLLLCKDISLPIYAFFCYNADENKTNIHIMYSSYMSITGVSNTRLFNCPTEYKGA